MAEAIARDICAAGKIEHQRLFSILPYEEETAMVRELAKGHPEFYLKYLLRDWAYFEEIEQVKPFFK